MFADEILDNPLRARFKNFWSGYACEKEVVQTTDFCRLTGAIEYVELPKIGVTPFWFKPGHGFQPHDHARQWEVTCPEVTPCLLTLCPGDVVTWQGKAKIYDAKIAFDNQVVVCRWPQYHAAMPWNAIHWFSGGYMGWSKALNWLGKKQPECLMSQQIFVDADATVMQCWEQDSGKDCHFGAIPHDAQWNPAPVIGVCAEIAEPSLARLSMYQSNLLETMSPPCVSWSKGGRSHGLNASAGFAFFEAIEQIAVTQPLMVMAECADETPKHPHFEMLAMTMKLIGYKSVWQQIVPLSQLAHTHRARWLAVWLRQDVPGKCIDANFTLRPNHFVPWHADSNKIFVPEIIQKQLVLSEELLEIYGDSSMLPPAKRMKYSSRDQVFQIRQAQLTNPLPTLCANYSQQHRLDERHLREKGIFATVRVIDDQVCFLDPLLFIALFGTVGKITLPCNIRQAFHMLGNAIAVPHALLAASVAFSAIEEFEWFPSTLVAECWQDRLQFASSVVRVVGDYFVVRPLFDFCLSPPIRSLSHQGDLDLFITSPNSAAKATGLVDSRTRVSTFIEEAIGIPEYLHGLITVVAGPVQMPGDARLHRLVAVNPSWRVVLDSLVLAVVDFSFTSSAEVSPTVPFTCLDVTEECVAKIEVYALPNDAFFDQKQLPHFLTLFEQEVACDHVERRPCRGFVLFFPLGVTAIVRDDGLPF